MDATETLKDWPVHSAGAFVVARRDGREGEVELVGSSGSMELVFEWASVTKLCTALAILVSVEEGTLRLDDPLGPPGSTVAHLLAHASGIGPDGRVLAPPGRRRIYSNAGFSLLGSYLEARSQIPFSGYLKEAVLDPLCMDRVEAPSNSTAEAAAYGLRGSTADLMALGRELLEPTLISRETLAVATTVAFGGLDGVLPGIGLLRPCDWGLGFELKDMKVPHWTGATNSASTFGHFGQAGGFLWVDPEAGVSCGALSDRTFGPWALAAWPSFADDVIDAIRRRSPATGG
ncbi:MAG: beta-lactamase family protein [Actinobacteria bacterium]|nr:beta-lactamase family protein [Actinomycetota bacterium]